MNVIVLAQKCGARASPGATLARSGFAGPSTRLPAIRRSRPARRAPHHGNLVAIEPSRRSWPKTVPGGGGRVVVTTSTPSTGIWVQRSPLPKSVGLLVSPGGALPFGAVAAQRRVEAACDARLVPLVARSGPAQPATARATTSPQAGDATRGGVGFSDDVELVSVLLLRKGERGRACPNPAVRARSVGSNQGLVGCYPRRCACGATPR
jgi:hypothetical protein